MDRSRTPLTLALLGLAVALGVGACRGGAGESGALPRMPIHPGAQLKDSQPAQADRDPLEFYLVPGTTAEAVRAWYRAEMPKRGWIASTPEDDDVVIYYDAEGCYAFVMVSEVEADVQLQLSHQRADAPCMRQLPVDPGSR